MVNVKEKIIKGKSYLYVSTNVSFKGHKKRFEKFVGPKNMKKKELDRKISFYSILLEMKKKIFKVILKTKYIKLKYLPQKYAFTLTMISTQYEDFLARFYPSELEKYLKEFDIRYIHHTTAIEGNTLSLMETGLVIDNGIAPKSKKLREIHEVENYNNVLEFVRNYKKSYS